MVGARPEFARRFVELIGKLAGNTPGDRQRKTVRLTAGDSECCRNAGVRSLSLVVMFNWFGPHPKKIGSGCRCASRRRTREWT
ncbi:hypothetical protein B296_00029800 [Ensete ventricosum]|uniref:Uncharacterized protein n=1 Tax=Ensete ventricosum TaxID=4639 RepID=A0A426Z6V1_ENSVE|nr:hypothetical protein B296_00029800 [Ensete ventricosum]